VVLEEKIKMWKVNGRSDAKWWQKLTLPLARWAKKYYDKKITQLVDIVFKYIHKIISNTFIIVQSTFIYDLKLQDKYNTCALSKHIGKSIPLCGKFSNHISRTFLNHSSHWFKLNDVMQVFGPFHCAG
jgi:hypothetical protein